MSGMTVLVAVAGVYPASLLTSWLEELIHFFPLAELS